MSAAAAAAIVSSAAGTGGEGAEHMQPRTSVATCSNVFVFALRPFTYAAWSSVLNGGVAAPDWSRAAGDAEAMEEGKEASDPSCARRPSAGTSS